MSELQAHRVNLLPLSLFPGLGYVEDWEQDKSGQVLGCCPPLGMADVSVGRRALCPTVVAVLVDAHGEGVYVEFEENVHTRDL